MRIAGGGVTLDLSALAESAFANIETIDLTGDGDNTLVLDLALVGTQMA